MDIQNVIARIERSAPLCGAAEWDKSGVQIAGTTRNITKLAVTLDPTPHAVAEALDWGAQCILTHHPLCMQPRFLDTPGRFLDVARGVLSRGAWLYAAHTSLDVQPAGPAGWLARALGLTDLSIIETTIADEAHPAGFGFAGRLPQPLGWDDFAATLGGLIERDFLLSIGAAPKRVETVAYCTGSGGSLIDAAAATGADVFITGDIKYHLALESDIFTVDVGHFSLEEIMTRIFAEELAPDMEKDGTTVRFFPGAEPFSLHTGPWPTRHK
jgi:dinuclear metal center YbgI/SA1388 family protein